jgi:hypothetical protein
MSSSSINELLQELVLVFGFEGLVRSPIALNGTLLCGFTVSLAALGLILYRVWGASSKSSSRLKGLNHSVEDRADGVRQCINTSLLSHQALFPGDEPDIPIPVSHSKVLQQTTKKK